VSVSDVQTVLKDHLSYPKSICRHPDIADHPLEQSASLFSVVMDLDAGRIMFSAYPVCESTPYTIDFTDLQSEPAAQTRRRDHSTKSTC